MSEGPSDHVEEREPRSPASTPASSRAAARARIEQQHTWVDLQVQQAIARGDFDDLPGAGKPIPDLGETHDPNWWVKKLIEREHVVVLPASIQLRKEDADLDDRLDGLTREAEVRREVDDFNQRVIAARYGLPEGPPLVTMPRDVDATVAAWADRRRTRLASRDRGATPRVVPRRRWWWAPRGDSPGTR
ncbi:DUF1992 domain-containing protein [Nocardioides sp.]|uniref:DnaJ family domain-containing protein n=1 Tax=Nocardioides sp. TaxID=35761 RepID=UPI003562CBBE